MWYSSTALPFFYTDLIPGIALLPNARYARCDTQTQKRKFVVCISSTPPSDAAFSSEFNYENEKLYVAWYGPKQVPKTADGLIFPDTSFLFPTDHLTAVYGRNKSTTRKPINFFPRILEHLNESAKRSANGKYYMIGCPFHSDKTPSLRIVENSVGGYCYACDKRWLLKDIYKKLTK